MEQGEVVRVSLPESDGKVRSRPALLIKKVPPYNDWLLCAISGSLHLERKGLDLLIDKSHPDFASSRLKYPALIRVVFLSTIPESQIEGKIGTVSMATYNIVIKNIAAFISNK